MHVEGKYILLGLLAVITTCTLLYIFFMHDSYEGEFHDPLLSPEDEEWYRKNRHDGGVPIQVQPLAQVALPAAQGQRESTTEQLVNNLGPSPAEQAPH